VTDSLSKDDQLTDYLLGRLSEPEQKRLERRLLLEDRLFQMGESLARGPQERAALADELQSLEEASDEEIEEHEQAVRAELFDACARGELGIEDRRWVDGLAEGSDRERLAFARTLTRETALARHRKPWIWQTVAGIAATLALVAGVIAIFAGQGGIPAEESRLPLALGAAIGAAVSRPELSVIEIYASITRDVEMAQISIPQQVSRQSFVLHLPAAAEDYPAFKVVILGPEGKFIAPPRKLDKTLDQALRFEEAMEGWKPGIYTFQIFNKGPEGRWETLAEAQVDVRRP
jgi:hypothetical protein